MEATSAVDSNRVVKKEYPPLLDELLRSGGIDSPKKIAVTAELVRLVGCSAALMLAQILYWWARRSPADFYKSDADWERELGLKRCRIITARERLEAMEIIKLKVRKAGMGYYVDLHVQANPAMPLHEAHVLSGMVKSAIRQAVPEVAGALIHMEPFEGRE